MATKKKSASAGRRVAIVAGLRSPFAKSSTVYNDLTTLDLALRVVAELMARSGLSGKEIDHVVYGQVVPAIPTPNIAREIVLGAGLPKEIEAYSVVRACATSTQAVVSGAQSILLGEADVVIAGGADSLSKPPITYRDRFVQALMKANSAKDPMSKLRAFGDVRAKDLLPQPPAIAEFSTGKTMGQCAEIMAKENGIPRDEQDRFALRSHQKAAEGWEKGLFAEEVMPFPVGPKYKEVVEKDNMVRPDTTLEKLSSLKPVFDRKHGTVTAGTASPLTDGASAVILMSEEKAKALGYEPLAFLDAWAFAAIDPGWQLLQGPAFAAPMALDKAGLTLEDMDLIDMHEAFAAQVLSNIQALGSKTFAQERLNRSKPVGEVPEEKLNIYGGSISIGHPFAATGTRQLLTMSRELSRRGGGHALITQCAAGGMGAAVILSR
ncbi:MAG: acetyl-CoA C-acyltransferase FadI [Deltaproteobacteria bacterium]|nr:acetyl-CoA C-acyltransferase FadI [Deltaproteobacteria bacterium]